MEINGEPVEFSKDEARKLYSNAPYLVRAIDRFVSKRENFTKG
jgi:hypothetical protein